MIFNLYYIKKHPTEGVNQVKGGRRVGTTPPRPLTLCEGSPPLLGEINEVKLGAARGYHAAPVVCAVKKKNPPLGGIIQLERGGVWISRCLVLAVAGKNSPPKR